MEFIMILAQRSFMLICNYESYLLAIKRAYQRREDMLFLRNNISQ